MQHLRRAFHHDLRVLHQGRLFQSSLREVWTLQRLLLLRGAPERRLACRHAKIGKMASFKERIDRHDREIAAIRKLIQAGMKMLVKSDRNLLRLEGDQMALRTEQIALRKELRELAASQRETDRLLQGFIRSLGRGGNGHIKGGIGI
jgi:hypothetical protein